MKYFNRVRMFSSTTGTGDTIALDLAVGAAFNTLAEAGAVAGDKTAVVVEQGSDYAIYRVTVNAGVASVNIDSVIISKIGGVVGTSRLNLGGSAMVRATDTAEDFNALLAALIAENFGSIAATPGNGAKQVQLRRGTTAQHGAFTGAPGEVTVDTNLNVLRVHDGATAGGHRTQPYDPATAKTNVAQTWAAPQVFKGNDIKFSHDDVTPGTGDMRVVVNKSAAAKNAGISFRDADSARALLGLLADDDFRLRVSPDGTNFLAAARAFNWCGRVDMRDSARRRYYEWFPNVNTTTLNTYGLTVTAAGTATAAALANTNLFTQSPRLIYASSTTAGTSVGVCGAQLSCWRGDAAGLGGFYLLMRFGWQQVQAQGRCFAGLRGSTSMIGNVNPSTLTDIIGVGFDSGQTTLNLLYNDASGAASAVDLGANFPSNQVHDLYELMLSAEPAASDVKWRLERLNTGDVASGAIDTDLPAASTFLTPHLWANNGTTAASVHIALHTMYLEIASLYGSRGA